MTTCHEMAHTLVDKSAGGSYWKCRIIQTYVITSMTWVTILKKKGPSLWQSIWYVSQWPGMLFTGDHAQLAGQLCYHTPQAHQPGTQWMENTAPPEGSAGPFFLLLQSGHKTPSQNTSILQKGTSSEPSLQLACSTYFLLALSCHLATPCTVWAYTEAIHDDICLHLKKLCTKGRGQKKKKKR